MKSIEFLEHKKEKIELFVSFIVFEPASYRISESDILVRGYDVKKLFDDIFMQVSQANSLSEKALHNTLSRINMMLDLVKNYDNVVMTKFINKVWRRYGFFSHLGESFLDLDRFVQFLPQFDKNDPDLILNQINTDTKNISESEERDNEANDDKDEADTAKTKNTD